LTRTRIWSLAELHTLLGVRVDSALAACKSSHCYPVLARVWTAATRQNPPLTCSRACDLVLSFTILMWMRKSDAQVLGAHGPPVGVRDAPTRRCHWIFPEMMELLNTCTEHVACCSWTAKPPCQTYVWPFTRQINDDSTAITTCDHQINIWKRKPRSRKRSFCIPRKGLKCVRHEWGDRGAISLSYPTVAMQGMCGRLTASSSPREIISWSRLIWR